MPAQDTAEITAGAIVATAGAAPGSQADRLLLIDGRLVTFDTTFASVGFTRSGPEVPTAPAQKGDA